MRWVMLPTCLFFFATACNRPAQEPPPNVLATSVSGTLTAEAIENPTAVPPISSSEPTPQDDPSSPTPEPAIETPAESPTSESTETPELSPTPPFTPVPLKAGDPRNGINLSDPDYADDFSDVRWYVNSDEDATFAWDDGRLRVSDHKTDGVLWWTTTALETEGAYAEVSVEAGVCGGKDAYGLALRVSGDNFDRGYTFEIACDGTYRVRKFVAFDELPEVLRDWTSSELLAESPNRIGFLVNRGQLYGFINGELLDAVPIEDSDYDSGVPSLFTNASQTSDLTVHFDDFWLWFLST